MQLTTRIVALGGAILGAAGLMGLGPIASTLPTAATTELEAGTYEVDGGHSSVIFSILHQGVSPAYGRFNKVAGAFEFGDSLETSSVQIEIATASVDTNSEDRDKHLRSPDFFNAKQYPRITFESKAIAAKGDDVYAVTGDLSFHGVSKEITIDMTFLGSGERGQFGHLAGFGGEVTIDRRDFGVTTYPGALGDEVRLQFGIEGRRK